MSDFLELSNINIVTRSLLSEDEFPILKGLSPLNMRILNGSSRLLEVDQGVETLHKGDNPRDLYFIRKGCVSIINDHGQQRDIIAKLNTGNVFGEFSILRKKPRYASVYTNETCEIICISAAAVHQVIEADQAFKSRLQSLLSQRMLNSFLFKHPIFQKLPQDLRLQFSKDLKTIFMPVDSQLTIQHEENKGILLILSGSVDIYHSDHSGREHLIEIRRDHDVIGELTLNQGKTSAYSAIASSDLDIFPLDHQTMLYIKNNHPETFKRLETYIHKRAQYTAKRLSNKSST
ncbi:MAG: cyclic nucleotide-binding domain-containing protein [Mariprofundaceae bacterium]|nr:cyclic nucleotide-binding domain-containing protein [Mariprofundaceae bacterium]